MLTEIAVYTALAQIVEYKEDKALNWAVNYAKAGIEMTGLELLVQCNYVLSNISHWRRKPEAQEVRNVLKQFIKENRS